MTLQEALKVSDLVVTERYPHLVYFLKGGDLYCRSLVGEFKSDMSLSEIFKTSWGAYIEPKPCAHEPDTLADEGYHVWLCRCGAKIKAEKWVEV